MFIILKKKKQIITVVTKIDILQYDILDHRPDQK